MPWRSISVIVCTATGCSEALALLLVEVAGADDDAPLLVDPGRGRAARDVEGAIAPAEGDRERHAVHVAGEARVGRVAVGVGVEPDRGAGAVHPCEAGEHAEGERVVTAEHQDEVAGAFRGLDGGRDLARHSDDRLEVLRAGIALARGLGPGDGDVTAVVDGVADPPQTLGEPRVADRGRPHVDATPALPEVEGDPDQRDAALRRHASSSATSASTTSAAPAISATGSPLGRQPTHDAARLADEQRATGPVPLVQPVLVVPVEAAARDPGEVERRRAGTAHVAYARQQPRGDRTLQRPALRLVREARGDQGAGEGLGTVHGERDAVAPGAATADRGERLARERLMDDADQRALRVLARDRHGERGLGVEEVDGPVERIDDPAQTARAARRRALLAEHRVVRALPVQERQDRRLGVAIGVGYGIGGRRLVGDSRGLDRRRARAAGRPPRGRRARQGPAARSDRTRHASSMRCVRGEPIPQERRRPRPGRDPHRAQLAAQIELLHRHGGQRPVRDLLLDGEAREQREAAARTARLSPSVLAASSAGTSTMPRSRSARSATARVPDAGSRAIHGSSSSSAGRIATRRAKRWPGRTTHSSTSVISIWDSRPSSGRSPRRTQLGVPGTHRREHARRVDDLDRDAQRATRGAEAREPLGQEVAGDGVARGDGERGGWIGLADRATRTVERGERRARLGVERASGGGRTHPRASALEQGLPDPALERGDPLRDGRLRQRQGVSCGVQRVRVDRGDERRELATRERIRRHRHG